MSLAAAYARATKSRLLTSSPVTPSPRLARLAFRFALRLHLPNLRFPYLHSFTRYLLVLLSLFTMGKSTTTKPVKSDKKTKSSVSTASTATPVKADKKADKKALKAQKKAEEEAERKRQAEEEERKKREAEEAAKKAAAAAEESSSDDSSDSDSDSSSDDEEEAKPAAAKANGKKAESSDDSSSDDSSDDEEVRLALDSRSRFFLADDLPCMVCSPPRLSRLLPARPPTSPRLRLPTERRLSARSLPPSPRLRRRLTTAVTRRRTRRRPRFVALFYIQWRSPYGSFTPLVRTIWLVARCQSSFTNVLTRCSLLQPAAAAAAKEDSSDSSDDSVRLHMHVQGAIDV